jgi:hypothetical protein
MLVKMPRLSAAAWTVEGEPASPVTVLGGAVNPPFAGVVQVVPPSTLLMTPAAAYSVAGVVGDDAMELTNFFHPVLTPVTFAAAAEGLAAGIFQVNFVAPEQSATGLTLISGQDRATFNIAVR